MSLESRADALDELERARAEYLAIARMQARTLAANGEPVTVDDVRRLCPPPPEIDGRVMGAIFRSSDWEIVGLVNSRRNTCHKRPIRVFRLAECAQ